MPNRTELGLFLQGLRFRKDESLTLMAARLGMTRSYLSAIELGKRRAPVELADKVVTAYELSRQEMEELYRVCMPREEDDIHRQVLTSVVINALNDYDDDFLLGLGMDIVREQGDTGPIPTEVAIGLADACDDNGGRLVRLSKDEVGLLASFLRDEIDGRRANTSSGAREDLDFEMWLEIHDYKMHELRWCTALYKKLTGDAYTPDDSDLEK